MELSKKISVKLFQASVNRNIQNEQICAIIALDCCRTIDIYHKFFHAALAFGIINCLNALEIPYSVVLFADFKFIYTIKTFDSPHNENIYKIILDSIMIERYSSRIADACIYIKKNVNHPKISNKRIFLISNGLDPNLRYGEEYNFLSDQKDKYCFFFIEPELKDDKEIINTIWNNFKREAKIEVAIIEDILDIINGEPKICTKFSDILLEKIFLTEEEKENEQKYIHINNIENKIFQPEYTETYKISKTTLEIINFLKYSILDEKFQKEFYLLNEPHKPSNIDSKILEKEIEVKPHFKIKSVSGEKIDKLTEFDIKGINTDLFDNIFPPNKPSMYCPSVKGTRLYIVGLVKYMITGG